jgi:hypothetical protein
LTGILLALSILLVIAASFFRKDVAPTMIPMGVFMVALWLSASRIARKKQDMTES